MLVLTLTEMCCAFLWPKGRAEKFFDAISDGHDLQSLQFARLATMYNKAPTGCAYFEKSLSRSDANLSYA